ncbi:MAG: ATP-binding cassette domain-containing protein [Gracilibacteraceae bacterium]|jgi:D-methionine transport system ATP-binding protein|nr:ATP-binding cassette domain-containing protein [Gracilibacteraceae bacterium]
MEEIIRFENVDKIFQNRKMSVTACKNIDLTVNKGDIFGVLGYSGAGKSTLIRMINALEKPTAGKVVVRGRPISELTGRELRLARKDIAMIFQQFNLLNSRTVFQNAAMPLVLNHVPKAEIKRRVDEILDFVELTDKAEAYSAKLSGGQMQRVGIARALTTNPSILLCDEPTSALDPKTQDSILGLLQKINRELAVTVVIITHQVGIVQKICNKAAVMENGRVVETGEVRAIFAKPRHPITKVFVDAVIDTSIPRLVLAEAQAARGAQRIVSVRVLGGNVCDTFVPDLAARFPVEVKTLSLSVNEIQEDVLSVFNLQLIGPEEETQKVLSYLGTRYDYEEIGADWSL